MIYTDEFDFLIRGAVAKYMPEGWDWLRNKAQLLQESLLKPNAVSKAGAKGIAQFMPGTWLEAIARMPLPIEASPLDPHYAIPASAWYDRQMWNGWTNPHRAMIDRWHLTLASYNAGFGNLEHAQRIANGAIDYPTIVSCLHEVTGAANAHETKQYIEKIDGYYAELRAAA